MNIYRTQRSFARADFTDEYGAACSIQDSSRATEECIWLGIDSVNGEIARMHLTIEMVEALLPLLRNFVQHGTIAPEV